MRAPSNYSFCSEFYVVEKVIEVEVSLKQPQNYPARTRIEALNQSGAYSTSAYILADVNIPQTYPSADQPPLHDGRIWIHYNLPWTDGSDADGALAQALDFLRDRRESH